MKSLSVLKFGVEIANVLDAHQHPILKAEFRYPGTDSTPCLSGGFKGIHYSKLVRELPVIGSIYLESGVDDADYQREAELVSSFIGKGRPPLLGQIASCREIIAGFEQWLERCRDFSVVGLRRV